MSVKTLAQVAYDKAQAYNVINNGVWEDLLYLPYEDAGTKRVSIVTEEVAYKPVANDVSFPYDFLVDNNTGAGNPRSLQIDTTLSHQFHAMGALKSFAFIHCCDSAIAASFVAASLGTVGASTSKLTVGGGAGVVDYRTAVQDDASAASSLTVGDLVFALVLDRLGETLSLYEAQVGQALSLVGQVTPTNAQVVQFEDPTAIIINPSFAGACYGTAFMATDGGVALPANLLDNIATMADNWVGGRLGLIL